MADGELRNPLPLTGSGGTIRPQFAPGGETLVLSWYYPPRFGAWDAATRDPRFAPVGYEQISSRYAVHPTAPLLAALNPERHLTLFSLETGEAVRTLDFALGRRVKCVAFAPDGLTCAVGGSNKQFAVFDVDV